MANLDRTQAGHERERHSTPIGRATRLALALLVCLGTTGVAPDRAAASEYYAVIVERFFGADIEFLAEDEFLYFDETEQRTLTDTARIDLIDLSLVHED